ncbi:MAG TPA: GAF domain-containing protein [Longimicrobiales bacterium]|nr:GAF domain-containing protein [Longimicrobiales bacterium]
MLEPIEIVKQLQEMRESGYLSDAILREAVKAIKAADPRYDWVGAYLLNPDEQVLWLHNYLGESAEQARIAVGEGVCGRAVAEKKNQNVSDVTEIEDYVACGPDAAAELVVLIRAGDEVLGELNLDSHRKGAFTAADEEAVATIADKLAEVLMAERR